MALIQESLRKVNYVPPEIRARVIRAAAEEQMTIDPNKSAELLVTIQQSVVRATGSETGVIQFGGRMLHPVFGRVEVRGRGQSTPDGVRASGRFEYIDVDPETGASPMVIFRIEPGNNNVGLVEDVMTAFERQIEGKGGNEIATISRQFGNVFGLVPTREVDGPVMRVASLVSQVDVRSQVIDLAKAPLVDRMAGKVKYALYFMNGVQINNFGEVEVRRNQKLKKAPSEKRQSLLMG